MSFTLTQGAVSVVLRNPDYANVERLTPNDIRRFTRGGDASVVMDTTHWAWMKTFVYKFSVITNTAHTPPNPVTDYVIDQLRDFLIDNAGLVITVTDHLGAVHNSLIYTPINEIISVRPDCSYSVSLELWG